MKKTKIKELTAEKWFADGVGRGGVERGSIGLGISVVPN